LVKVDVLDCAGGCKGAAAAECAMLGTAAVHCQAGKHRFKHTWRGSAGCAAA
jgi:predicted glycosyltransferase